MDALRQLFIGSLNFAVAASWLIAVILLLRPLLKKFAPKWVLCGLWAFVAIRLVCPVMLHSDVSVYRLAGDAVQSSGQVTYFQDTGFCGDVRYRPATLLPGASSSAVMPSTAEDPAPEGSVDAAAQTRAPSRFVGMNIPAIVWAALGRMNVAPEKAVMLGDSAAADIPAANAAGVFSILFTNGRPAPAEHGACAAARSYEEALALILG